MTSTSFPGSNPFSITISVCEFAKFCFVFFFFQIEMATVGVKNKDKIQSRHFNREIIYELFRKHAAKLEGQWPAYDGRTFLILTKKLFDEHIFTVSTSNF